MHPSAEPFIVEHVNTVKQHISEGKKVVILAHSFGSVYANKIYERLNSIERNSVGLMLLAPVSDYVASGN